MVTVIADNVEQCVEQSILPKRKLAKEEEHVL
jgi:hypothetical protein